MKIKENSFRWSLVRKHLVHENRLAIFTDNVDTHGANVLQALTDKYLPYLGLPDFPKANGISRTVWCSDKQDGWLDDRR